MNVRLLTAISVFAYPIYDMMRDEVDDVISRPKLPSAFVSVPLLVPFSETEAPASVLPSSAVTFPLITNWEKELEQKFMQLALRQMIRLVAFPRNFL